MEADLFLYICIYFTPQTITKFCNLIQQQKVLQLYWILWVRYERLWNCVSASLPPPPPIRTRRVCVCPRRLWARRLSRAGPTPATTAASSLRALELNIKRRYYIKHATCTRMQMGCRAHTVPPLCTLSLARTHVWVCEWRSLVPNGTGSNVQWYPCELGGWSRARWWSAWACYRDDRAPVGWWEIFILEFRFDLFFSFWKEPYATFTSLQQVLLSTEPTASRESTAGMTQRPLCVLCVLLVYFFPAAFSAFLISLTTILTFREWSQKIQSLGYFYCYSNLGFWSFKDLHFSYPQCYVRNHEDCLDVSHTGMIPYFYIIC